MQSELLEISLKNPFGEHDVSDMLVDYAKSILDTIIPFYRKVIVSDNRNWNFQWYRKCIHKLKKMDGLKQNSHYFVINNTHKPQLHKYRMHIISLI